MKTEAEVSAPMSTPPFELDQLAWSNNGTVAHTSDLETARLAEKQFRAAEMCIVQAKGLGHGVYEFVYAKVHVGSFSWGSQVGWDKEFCLYYFGSFDELSFVVLDDEGYVHFTGPYEKAEVIHRTRSQEGYRLRLWPTLGE